MTELIEKQYCSLVEAARDLHHGELRWLPVYLKFEMLFALVREGEWKSKDKHRVMHITVEGDKH